MGGGGGWPIGDVTCGAAEQFCREPRNVALFIASLNLGGKARGTIESNQSVCRFRLISHQIAEPENYSL